MVEKRAAILRTAAVSDTGRVRKENQDSFGHLDFHRGPYRAGRLLILADGMGGEEGGAEAARIAVKAIRQYFSETPDVEPDIALATAIQRANEAIHEQRLKDPAHDRMGSTVVIAMIRAGYIFAAHVGDSRLWLLRDGELTRLSRDHTMVQRLAESGLIAEELTRNHPQGHILYRALGEGDRLKVEVLAPPRRLQSGDRVLLCSDGLHGELEDNEIASILGQGGAEEAAQNLVDAANEAGGRDNVTVLVGTFDREGEEETQADTAQSRQAKEDAAPVSPVTATTSAKVPPPSVETPLPSSTRESRGLSLLFAALVGGVCGVLVGLYARHDLPRPVNRPCVEGRKVAGTAGSEGAVRSKRTRRVGSGTTSSTIPPPLVLEEISISGSGRR